MINLKKFLFDTLRGRLILSVALIHAIMMTLFIVDLTARQRAMLLDNQSDAAIAMSQSLATSAAGWIAADDLSGLQELADAQRRYPEMSFVIFTDDLGHVLASADKSKVGLYLLDLPETPHLTVLSRSAALVDVAAPAMLDNRHVGWVRVGLEQKAAAQKLSQITLTGILYALLAIAIGSLIAWRMGSRITKRLYAVQDTIGEVKKGVQSARANVTGNDEAASIAYEFNSMLDALAERDANLSASEERYRMVFENSPVPIWEEDFSGVKAIFDSLREEGVTDIETYFSQHPEVVQRCAEAAKVVDINIASVALHAAENKEQLLAGLVTTFTPESFDVFQHELICLWNGAMEMKTDAVVKTLAGERRNVTVYFSICPGYESTLAKALVSLIDITERKRYEAEREAIITVSNALRKATTRNEIFTVILDQFISLFDADGAMLTLPHATLEDVVIEMGRGIIGEKFNGLHIPPGKGMSRWVIENRKPYLNNAAHLDPLFYYQEILGDSHCAAAVPLIAREKSIGAVWIVRKKEIKSGEMRLFSAIADIAANAIHRVMLHEQTEQQLHHLIALHQIDLAITANLELNITLGVVLRSVKDELNVDAASILLLDSITNALSYIAGIGFRTRTIESARISLNDKYAGRAAMEYCTVSCPDLSAESESFNRPDLLAEEQFMAYYAAPLIVKGQVKGVLEVFHRKPFKSDADWLAYLETLATQTAIAIESMSLFENLQRSHLELMQAYDATIEGWSRALDLRDKETEGHTRRVTEMAVQLGEKVGMSSQEVLNLRRGALLHDIGKMGIPDAILHKPDTLSPEEWIVMRRHPAYSYEMLSQIKYLKDAVIVPYCHHERWDGSGYPRGLKGEEIPLSARVFAIVDVFDALTSNRPYRSAISHKEAYRYIQEQAGIQFDPEIVKIFLEGRL